MKSIINELEKGNSAEVVAKMILNSIDEYSIVELILPDGRKELYESCAKVISCLPVDTVSKYSSELLEWFQDLNWPGVNTVYEALKRLPAEKIKSALSEALQHARDTGDEEWIYNMNEQFSDMLTNKD